MQVYVVQSVVQYEGASFRGVYASEEAARQAISAHYRRELKEDGFVCVSWYEIVVCQLGEEVCPFSHDDSIIIELYELEGV